jgi:hypothetical protein
MPPYISVWLFLLSCLSMCFAYFGTVSDHLTKGNVFKKGGMVFNGVPGEYHLPAASH